MSQATFPVSSLGEKAETPVTASPVLLSGLWPREMLPVDGASLLHPHCGPQGLPQSLLP